MRVGSDNFLWSLSFLEDVIFLIFDFVTLKLEIQNTQDRK